MQESVRRRMVAMKLWTASHKAGDKQVYLSFEDLGVKFQEPCAMDLRSRGLAVLGTDNSGKCGMALSSYAVGIDQHELYERAK